MMSQHNDLVLKSVARDVAEKFQREAASERLAHELQDPAPKRRARNLGARLILLGRRLMHAPPASSS